MPFLEKMFWQGWSNKSAKEYNNYIPQMPNKFVERAFLVGGFVGSKSQAGSYPYRTPISLNEVIFEQLLFRLGLLDISTNSHNSTKMMSEKVPFQNFQNNWRSQNMDCYNYNWRTMKNKSVDRNPSYFGQFSTADNKSYEFKSSNSSPEVPLTKHKQEELVYEDKDAGGNSIYVYQEVQKSTCEVTKTSMFHVKSRTVSECSIESDDSFIIFESSDDCDDVIASPEEDEDEDEDEEEITYITENNEFDDSSSDESDLFDEVDYLAPGSEWHTHGDTPSRIEEANKKWKEVYGGIIIPTKSPKKVSFACGKQLTKVHPMVTWDFAFRAARKSPWGTLALDRSRFKRKIDQISNIISPILEQSHRKRIYQQRFHTISSSNIV